MQHDDVPLPTNKYRRRSLFDTENEVENKTVQIHVPEAKCEIYYPLEYIEKVRTEIEQWKMHITKTLEKRQKFKNEKMVLQNTVLDENILSAQQYEFFASLKFDEYMRQVKKFCNRIEIFAEKMQYKPENDIERKCITIQNKIEKDVLENHFK